MGVGSIAYNRHLRILDLLKEKGSVRVENLSEMLNVSQVTIRRDLDYLNSKKLLVRTHGGASSAEARKGTVPESRYTDKDGINVQEKQRIARRCVELIEDDEILFLNSGSSVIFFLRALHDRKVKVITNNAAAIELQIDPQAELMILGGEYREQSRSFVGEFAINTLRDIYSSHTILGTNGISLDRGLTTTVYQECSINRAMIANTHGKVIVLADYTKLGRISNFVSASLSEIDILITDERCPPEFKEGLERMGVEVIIA